MRWPAFSTSMIPLASLFASRSSMAPVIWRESSSISWGNAIPSLATLVDKLMQEHAGDHVKRLEHTFALGSRGSKRRNLHIAVVEQVFHVFHRCHCGHVTL